MPVGPSQSRDFRTDSEYAVRFYKKQRIATMKKTLTALAVLGAFAGSAFAADVTLYGIVDFGLNYTHSDKDNGTKSTDTFTLDSGIQSGSRFGLKGVEDLGNGYQVGFVLENGFTADDGKLGQENRLFGREALLYVTAPWGEIGAGRTGMATGSIGRYTLYGKSSAFGTSYSGPTGSVNQYLAQAGGNNDNMLTYRTPKFGGFQAQVQYSFKQNNQTATAYSGNTSTDWATNNDKENTSGTDRAYGAAITYAGGPVWGFLSVEGVNYKSWDGTVATDVDDALIVTAGGNYDFGVAKVFVGAQYFDEVKMSKFGNNANLGYSVTAASSHINKAKGYGLSVSASIPAFGGTALVGAGYLDGDDCAANSDREFSRYGVHAGYTYNLSKRTNIYSALGYEKDSYDATDGKEYEPSSYKAVLGIRHTF